MCVFSFLFFFWASTIERGGDMRENECRQKKWRYYTSEKSRGKLKWERQKGEKNGVLIKLKPMMTTTAVLKVYLFLSFFLSFFLSCILTHISRSQDVRFRARISNTHSSDFIQDIRFRARISDTRGDLFRQH